MTASPTFLGLSKLVIRETMCRFFLKKKSHHHAHMTAPSAFWIQIYEDMSYERALNSYFLPQNLP